MIQNRRVGQFQCFSNKQIGKGFSSKVYLGQDTVSRAPVVFKIIDNQTISTSVMQMLVSNEIRAIQLLDHPYILQIYKVQRTPKEIQIVSQYCPGGDLMENILREGAIDQNDALQILTQIAGGVNYIHSLGILHRDLKTSNILISEDGSIRITDFGFCEFIKERPPGHKLVNVGSPLYMSPEAYKSNQYSTKSDIWSLGVILYQMLIGTTPFIGLYYQQMVENVRNGNLIRSLSVSDNVKGILFGLLQVNPQNRWDTTRLLTQLSHFQSTNSCCGGNGYSINRTFFQNSQQFRWCCF